MWHKGYEISRTVKILLHKVKIKLDNTLEEKERNDYFQKCPPRGFQK